MRTLILTFTLAAVAFSQSTHYARAYYTKWKPGKAAEGQAFLKQVPYQASLAWLKGDPAAVGQVTMTRLLPGGTAPAHDRLRLVITNAPPALPGIGPGSAQFVEEAGMKAADYSAKLGSLLENVRMEVWRSFYRHGSIREGQLVMVRRWVVPEHKRAARVAATRNWDDANYAQAIKSGGLLGSEGWSTMFGAENEPSFTYLHVYAGFDALYAGRGNLAEIFAKAHPGKDYKEFQRVAQQVGEDGLVSESIVYRVDAVVWK